MSKDIKLLEVPKWGLSMEEGTINQWLVNEGDAIEVGTEIVEIESSKIVNVVEASFAGILRRILVQSGETNPVGYPIAVVADASVSDSDIDSFLAANVKVSANDSQPEEQAETPASLDNNGAVSATNSANDSPTKNNQTVSSQGSSYQIPERLKQGDDDSSVRATLHARRIAKDLGINLHNITISGRNERVSKRDIEQAILAAGGSIAVSNRQVNPQVASSKDDSAVSATPVARRLAKEHGINLHDCRATGSRGRVAKTDVEALLNLSAANSTVVDNAGGASISTASNDSQAQDVTVIPMEGMRKVIASRLQESKQTAPHFRLVVDVNIDELLSLRKRINQVNSRAKISVNDIIVKATAAALIEVPQCNIQFDGKTIKQFSHADISVAVAIDGGLITPIVKRADQKGLVEISNDIRHLVTKAKAGTLTPSEFQGGTFTISNLGMFGIKQFDAIINPPHGAILAVGGGEQRVIVKDGEPAVATMMTITLSSDHRVINGSEGAQLLQVIKRLLEDPAMMIS